MNEITPIKPDLAEPVTVGNRLALLLPEGFGLPDGRWVIFAYGDGFRLRPYVEEDWAWGDGLFGCMDDELARAIMAGKIGPDHPDNALDDEPIFDD